MTLSHRSWRSPVLLAGVVTSLTALLIGLGATVVLIRQTSPSPATLTLAAGLTLALAASNRFPIHLHVSGKVYMGTAVLFLAAALLPPPLAGCAALAGLLAGELSARAVTGNPIHAVVTQAGRWAIIAFLGSVIAHAASPPAGMVATTLVTIGAAAFLYSADVLSFPLVYCPATGDSPLRAMRMALQGGGPVEAAQYLVGLLGYFGTAHGDWTLVLLLIPVALVYVVSKQNKEMRNETRHILENMADAVDLRDSYTGGHSRRVTEYVEGVLREMGKRGPEAQLITSAARVHDIGKIGIPDHVLQKSGALTDDEWAIMKQHPERGADLLARYPDFARGVEIIRHHHERWDGQGYPHRLGGRDIPFGARVIAVADSYDAMTSDRPYRRGMSPERAIQILREGRGVQWDAQIVDAFVASLPELSARPHLELVQPLSTVSLPA